MDLFEWQKQPFACEDEAGFQTYLEQVWERRPLLYSEDTYSENSEPDDSVQRFFDFSPGYIKARNYVGFVQYGNTRLNVYPQVFESRTGLTPGNKIQHLLKWLSYSRRIHFPYLDSTFDSDTNQEDWLEAYIFLFASYTERALITSPYSTYQEVIEETAFIKGRLAINEYITNNLAKGRHHLVHCAYEPFMYNNLFNKVVKYTCKLLKGITNSSVNSHLLQNILFVLDEVDDLYYTASDCERISVNRMYPEVERIKNMCSLFLMNHMYNNDGSNNSNICILLPMEVIFEEFVFGFLEKHFAFLQPRRQVSDMYLAKTGEGFTTNVFRMKHDILIPGKLIIDTKYKKRPRNNDNKGGVSQNDLYQMIAYGFRRGINDMVLIYPSIINCENSSKLFKIPHAELQENTLSISAISLDIVVNNMEKFIIEIKERLQVIKNFY